MTLQSRLTATLVTGLAAVLVAARELESFSRAQGGGTFAEAAILGGSLAAVVVLVALSIVPVTRQIGRVAGSLEERAGQVKASAAQVSATSLPIAEGASEQAASLEETSASLEAMSSMTKRNAESSETASQLARQARSAAERGAADMVDMKAAMEAMQTSSEAVNKIVKTIDEIAFQTNILALNAAVEAARAGEAGLSFAVVADEVRNLAQRCTQSARETAGLIGEAVANAGRGVEISGKVATGLQEIVTKVRQLDELAAEVAAASKEQNQGVSQINAAVAEMDKVTQRNAASAEQSASAAERLDSQVQAQDEAVAELLSMVNHGRAAPAAECDSTSSAPKTPDWSVNRPASRPSRSESNISRTRSPGPLLRPHGEQIPSPLAGPGLIQWDQGRMTTGFPEVDGEHQELIAMINSLHAACLDGTGKSELGKMLEFLGCYVQTHFQHEEELMEQHGCAAKDSNKIAHAKFLKEFEKLAAEFKAKGESTAIVLGLKGLVTQWLTHHICGVDVKLRQCVPADAMA